MNQPNTTAGPDRRSLILDAALAVLSEDGYPAFSQPRVAARAGMRPSHLSYYFPTRAALLVAVARRVVEAQLAFTGSMLEGASATAAASNIAKAVSRPENVRVLLMLVSASDEVPEVRELFRELAAGMVGLGHRLLRSLDAKQTDGGANILPALSVGLAVIGFATGRSDGEAWAEATLEATLDLLCQGDAS